MPWFRFRRRKEELEAAQVAAQEAPAPPEEQADEQDDDTQAAEGAAPGKPRRRRGSRGGRGRRKPTATAEAASAQPEEKPTARREPASDRGAKKRTTPRSGGRERRRQAPRRAPLPEAKRELLISVDVGEQRVALLEDDRVAEVYLERPERRSITGNIYVGTVDNVLPGMECAFVEIGLERNGFLYVDEIVVPELEGKRHGKKITDLIQRGQQIIVQAVKDPMKTKGARLTTEISLPGRFLVYVPNGEGLGVSRRLDDAERQRLKDILKGIAPSTGGVIVRTAAEGASAEDIERDLVFLQRLWKTIQARAKSAGPPELVYQEAELPLRIVRDLFAGDFVAAHVDSERTYKRIVGYLKKTSPHMVERVHRTKEKEPLFERFGVEKEIASTLDRRVDLPSGGYLVFDYAEAFTVVDVNTGSFVGSRSKNSPQRLEDTIVKNNLEAVKEVVRQLRLRDIGGIIVIDFIDMANPKNRQAVEDALRTELERDRTKTYVVEISPLGLVEMTRQKVTDGPREVMTRKCPTCGGDGIVVSDATVALGVERRLRSLAVASAGSRVQAYRVAVHPKTLSLLAGPGGSRLAALEDATRRHFYLVAADGHVHADHLEVLAEGRTADLAPAAPVEVGQEHELKLVEIDLHDGGAAVGRVDGYDVVVAGAAKLVGKKATVRIGAVLDGQAFAAPMDAVSAVAPITFESEAEKPTRAPSRRKTDVEPEAAPVVAEPGEAPDAEEDAALEPEPVTDVAEEDGEGAPATPRKRTRRGSRGGKRRKKTTTTGEGLAAEAAAETDGAAASDGAAPLEAEQEATPASTRPRRRQPRIHVPVEPDEATNGDGSADEAPDVSVEAPPEAVAEDPAQADGAPPKKRTRRGTRGGRSRKKKAPGVTNGDSASPDGASAPAPERGAESDGAPEPGQGNPEYVPMSEWIEDFDRK